MREPHRGRRSRSSPRSPSWRGSPTSSATPTSAGTAHGYPDGLAGEEIPLGSRIIFCADAFHAIRSDRPYRPGRPRREVARRAPGATPAPSSTPTSSRRSRRSSATFASSPRRARVRRSSRLMALLLCLGVGFTGLRDRPLRAARRAAARLQAAGCHSCSAPRIVVSAPAVQAACSAPGHLRRARSAAQRWRPRRRRAALDDAAPAGGQWTRSGRGPGVGARTRRAGDQRGGAGETGDGGRAARRRRATATPTATRHGKPAATATATAGGKDENPEATATAAPTAIDKPARTTNSGRPATRQQPARRRHAGGGRGPGRLRWPGGRVERLRQRPRRPGRPERRRLERPARARP